MTESAWSPEFADLQRALAGRYSLVRELGRGGMGVVFLARDVALDRLVAIKLLPPGLSVDPVFRERFLNEARMAASLAHPHIVPIHAVETHGDLVCFAMSFVDGESLGQRVRRRGPLGAGEVARIMQEVAWALAHAHARGIVHRDVKPDNILLDGESGRALVTDFGIARASAAAPATPDGPAGTPHYLSPEQIAGSPGDARSDLYALGVTAWFGLTGGHPFDAPTLSSLLVQQATSPAPRLLAVAPAVPPRLANAVDRCLERHSADRWASAEELAVELNAVRAKSGELAGPVRQWARDVLPAGSDIGMGIGGVAASIGVWAVLGWAASGQGVGSMFDNLFIGFAMTTMAVLFGGLSLTRFASVLMSTRDLVEDGFDHDAARPAVVEANAEEADARRHTSRSERRKRALAYGLTGAAKTALALWLAGLDDPAWLYLPATVFAVLLPILTVRTVWSQLREGPSLWSRLLQGRFGRLLFRGVRRFSRPPRATAAGQPTAAAVGLEAEALLRALPPGVRDGLQDLPGILARLREEADRLREARDGSPVRLSGIVAAMESVRLELLAMNAGARSIPDVTRNLEEARRIAERLDREFRRRGLDRSVSGAPEPDSVP